MGLLDWTNEYINPFADSNRERAERQAEQGRRDASTGILPVEDLLREEQIQPPAGGTARAERPNLAPLSEHQMQLMTFYGLSENLVRRKVRDNGQTRPLGDIIAELHALDESETEDLQRKLFRAGFFGSAKPSDIQWGRWDSNTLGASISMFDEVSRVTASRQGAAPNWRDYLEEAQEEGEAGGASRQKATRLSTEGDAYSTLRSAMEDMLGRRPNAREVRRFRRRLNQAELANPTVVSSGLGEDEGDLSSEFGDLTPDTDEVQDGGFAEGDAMMLAEEEIMRENGIEAGAFQVGNLTTAFERLMLGS